MSKPSQRGLNLTSGFTPIFSESVCVGFMRDALQARVDIDCIFDGGRIRQRFYRVRQRCQARGDHRFDELKFQRDAFWLVITRRGATTTRRRRAVFDALGSVRRFVYVQDIDLDGLDDDTE